MWGAILHWVSALLNSTYFQMVCRMFRSLTLINVYRCKCSLCFAEVRHEIPL